MPEQHIAPDAWRRERWIVLAIVIATVLARSSIFVLVIRTFEREPGLRPAPAAASAWPFVLPPVAMSAVFVEASGGSLGPFVWVLVHAGDAVRLSRRPGPGGSARVPGIYQCP